MRTLSKISLVGAVCAGVLSTAAFSQPDYSRPSAPPPVAGAPGEAPNGARQASWILSRIHEANRQEIRLGRLAMDRAGSDRVRDYARQLVEDHRRSDERLTDLAQRKGIDLSAPGTFAGDRPGSDDEGQADELRNAHGREFDRQFVRTMERTHERLIAQLQRASDRIQDPDIRQFVDHTTAHLQEHRQRAEDLRRDLD